MTTKRSDAASEDVQDGVAVTFARPWTLNGVDYQPDQTAKVSSADADEVLRLGYARPADKKES